MKLNHAAAALTAAVALFGASQGALAFTGVATNNLHLRTGPGEQYPVAATIPHRSPVQVDGCLEGITWCAINWDGAEGWVAADYVAYDSNQGVKVLPLAGDLIDIPIVTFTAVDAEVPTFVGQIETVNEVVTAITPPQQVSAYVSEQTVDTIHVKGEVVVGAVVPQDVPLYAVPQSKYTFTRVNGVNVLVTNDRQIVHIFQ